MVSLKSSWPTNFVHIEPQWKSSVMQNANWPVVGLITEPKIHADHFDDENEPWPNSRAWNRFRNLSQSTLQFTITSTENGISAIVKSLNSIVTLPWLSGVNLPPDIQHLIDASGLLWFLWQCRYTIFFYTAWFRGLLKKLGNSARDIFFWWNLLQKNFSQSFCSSGRFGSWRSGIFFSVTV